MNVHDGSRPPTFARPTTFTHLDRSLWTRLIQQMIKLSLCRIAYAIALQALLISSTKFFVTVFLQKICHRYFYKCHRFIYKCHRFIYKCHRYFYKCRRFFTIVTVFFTKSDFDHLSPFWYTIHDSYHLNQTIVYEIVYDR